MATPNLEEMLAPFEAKCRALAKYVSETEEGLREWSRTGGKEGMHPVHAANRLRIVREQIAKEEK